MSGAPDNESEPAKTDALYAAHTALCEQHGQRLGNAGFQAIVWIEMMLDHKSEYPKPPTKKEVEEVILICEVLAKEAKRALKENPPPMESSTTSPDPRQTNIFNLVEKGTS